MFVGKSRDLGGDGARTGSNGDAVVLTSCGERFETFMVTSSYDATKRAPEFSSADQTCLWEASEFTRHFHPSVGRFATSLLVSEDLEYRGNPLKDMTAQAFLDKFVMRNPKVARVAEAEEDGAAGVEDGSLAEAASTAKDDAYLGIPSEDAVAPGRRGVRGNSFQQPITNFDDVPRMFDLAAPSDKSRLEAKEGVAFHQLYASVASAKPTRGRTSASNLKRKSKGKSVGDDDDDDDDDDRHDHFRAKAKRARRKNEPARPIA